MAVQWEEVIKMECTTENGTRNFQGRSTFIYQDELSIYVELQSWVFTTPTAVQGKRLSRQNSWKHGVSDATKLTWTYRSIQGTTRTRLKCFRNDAKLVLDQREYDMVQLGLPHVWNHNIPWELWRCKAAVHSAVRNDDQLPQWRWRQAAASNACSKKL